ncbi:MAG: hypothetical protein AB1758_28955, partial [Candidatus Eremiobacterota bacterium]
MQVTSYNYIAPQRATAPKSQPAPPKDPKEELPVMKSDLLAIDTELTVSINGQPAMKLKGEKENWGTRVARQSKLFISAAANELVGIASANPAMAFNATASAIKPMVLDGMPRQYVAATEEIFVPLQRGVVIAFDALKAYQRWKQNRALGDDAGGMDQVGMLVDGAHVATDAVGLVSSFARYIPALAGAAAIGLVIAIAGDIAAYSFNFIEYIG